MNWFFDFLDRVRAAYRARRAAKAAIDLQSGAEILAKAEAEAAEMEASTPSVVAPAVPVIVAALPVSPAPTTPAVVNAPVLPILTN